MADIELQTIQINTLKLKNFRCYDELEIDFDPRLTVIVGENGRGKSTVFDALALAWEPYLRTFAQKGQLLSTKDVRRVPVYQEDGVHIAKMQSQYPVQIELDGGTKDASFTTRLSLDAAGEHGGFADDMVSLGLKLGNAVVEQEKVVLPALAYYGTSRIWVDSSLMEHYDDTLTERREGYVECLEPSSSYNTFGKWFEKITRQALDEEQQGTEAMQHNRLIQRAVQRAIDDCMASTGMHDLYYNFKLGAFIISAPDNSERFVDELSDGFRSMLSMVADLAYRMVRLNPHLGEHAVLETPGIVMIDEVEMHLHPLWQQTVLLDLQKAFPKVQFIVTTHSPQVLSSVPAESVRVLEWEGLHFVGVKRVSFALGAASHQLLQDIQNVNPRSERLPIVRDLQRYLQLVGEDAWDSEEALALRKKLDEWAQGNEPALLRADMDIRMRKFRRQRS